MAREALGSTNVPDWDARDPRDGRRELWSGDIARLPFISFHGGIRRDWEYACLVADNSRLVAENDYHRSSDMVLRHRRRSAGTNPF